MLTSDKKNGFITMLVIVFGSIIMILFGGILNFILTQIKTSGQRVAFEQSIYIAEAGVDYYKWCINHNIDDCLLEQDYFDSYGQSIGGFSIAENANKSCGQTISKEIIATGWTKNYPDVKRKVSVVYGRPSIAKYSYFLNDSVWAGDDRQIRGLYHSNNGIRMDGTNYSLVTSYLPEWICTSSFGCSPCPTNKGCRISENKCYCPGVFTTTNNAKQELFHFPSDYFDFAGITIDLNDIKEAAEDNLSYFPYSTDIDPQAKGYHVKLKDNGDYEVWIITQLSYVSGYSLEEGWQNDYFIISNEYLYGTYAINPACAAIFFEDDLWIEGTLKGKATIASADLISSTDETNIILPGSIFYTANNGEDELGLISEKNILISPVSPDTMTLNGGFIAQSGRFGRNHYVNNIRNLLTMYGATISCNRTGTQWTSGSQIVSGYMVREDYVDNNLIYSAPPFFPYLDLDFRVIKWEEII